MHSVVLEVVVAAVVALREVDVLVAVDGDGAALEVLLQLLLVSIDVDVLVVRVVRLQPLERLDDSVPVNDLSQYLHRLLVRQIPENELNVLVDVRH